MAQRVLTRRSRWPTSSRRSSSGPPVRRSAASGCPRPARRERRPARRCGQTCRARGSSAASWPSAGSPPERLVHRARSRSAQRRPTRVGSPPAPRRDLSRGRGPTAGRPARVRAGRRQLRRRHARHRRPRPRRRQGTQATCRPAHQGGQGGPRRLACRARRPARRAAVPDAHRPASEPRRRRAPRRHPRRDRSRSAAHRCTASAIHPHVLRHSCAMSLLHAGVDSTVIALWLGHADVRSTQPYIHADMTIKERALALVTPATVAPRPLHAHRRRARLPRQPRITMPTSPRPRHLEKPAATRRSRHAARTTVSA